MAHRSRQDSPGTWHHVVNRAIARRPLFEDRGDMRFFLSRLVREVRKGRLEVLIELIGMRFGMEDSRIPDLIYSKSGIS